MYRKLVPHFCDFQLSTLEAFTLLCSQELCDDGRQGSGENQQFSTDCNSVSKL